MKRETLQVTPRDNILWSNCQGNELSAQIAWLAIDHTTPARNQSNVDFVNRNPRRRTLVEGYQKQTPVTGAFADGVEAYGWDDLDRIKVSKRLFNRVLRARELAINHGLPKEHFYRVYDDWLDSCIERNIKDLVPSLQEALNTDTGRGVTLLTGLGHPFLDPSVQPLIPKNLTLNVHSRVISTLGSIVSDTSVVVFSESLPKYFQDFQEVESA